ncbi:MAG: NAD(P)/FAD-dependent oxidoreductase, partial [Pseudomonadota bacterium]
MSAKAVHHKVCVVGAGPCGLTAIESLVRNGISDVICHEAQDTIGGLWAFSEDTKRPSVYDSAHIISSRRMSAFRDFPMPKEYPDFPSHKQILAYFESYADLHQLRSHIRFKSSVQSAERMADGGWCLIIEDEDGTHEETADFLVVAAGHHRKPFTPQIASDFDGEQLHSSQYRSTKGFEGKRVLVVGAGNSACDIAASLAQVSDHVSLSMRSPQYIVPKTIYGRPVDVQFGKIQGLPNFARRLILRLGLRIFMGRYGNYGLPQPDADVLSSHPTLNTDILEMLTHGKVAICSETKEASGNSIKFSNGDS